MVELTERGPISILCDEIGYQFRARLEEPELLVEFVGVLVFHVAEARHIQDAIAHVTGKSPSGNSAEVLRRVEEMLAGDLDGMTERAVRVHGFIDEVLPEDTYPTDRLIDMLSGCVSAIRFGLERPCRSRHAAEAASHVWQQRYGVHLSDKHTSAWQHDWTREQLREAITRLSVRKAVGSRDALLARLAGALREAGNALDDIAETTWLKRHPDATRIACEQACQIACDEREKARAALAEFDVMGKADG